MCPIPSSLWLNVAPGFPRAETIPEASSASLPQTLLDELWPTAVTISWAQMNAAKPQRSAQYIKKPPNMMETVWVHPAHTVVLWNGFMFKITDQLESFLSWWPLTWGQSGVKGCSRTGSSAVMPKRPSYCSRIIASWKASIHLKTKNTNKDEQNP